jgi:hypothetical protein
VTVTRRRRRRRRRESERKIADSVMLMHKQMMKI